MRERSRRASAQPAVGRRGLRPRDQEEQRTQRASFAATNHTGVHTAAAAAAAAAGHRAGLGCLVAKKTREAPRHVSSRPPDQSQSAQAWMLESRAEQRALGASLRGARHSTSRRWLECSLSPKT